MQFRAKQIAPPKEWGTFEDLCHAIFKKMWRDPLAQKNGRRGQTQHGVDVFGSQNSDHSSYQGVQCKGKDNNYGSKAEWSEVLIELAKAEKFSPKLEQWIYATTAPVDATLQRAARNLSVERKAKGLFSVDVLGWEEIQALMVDAPEVIAEFYPEHADHLPQVIEALRALPALEAKLTDFVEQIKPLVLSGTHGHTAWKKVEFDSERGLGPALMGYPLGPSDAAACPRLTEVNVLLSKLRIAYSSRLIGEPGSGKSICSYQAAREIASEGYEVWQLIDPKAEDIALNATLPGMRCLYLIDDAHLIKHQTLIRLEQQANATQLIVSTHNAIEHASHPSAITLDAKRAVKTIAAALRGDLPKTLAAVRLADNWVGERMMDVDIEERLEHAETVADRPWQFCFVLGGGWRRSKEAADSARAANADLVLAAVAMRQLVSRDARALPAEIVDICQHAEIDINIVDPALRWLEMQRLLIAASDCRTPHQRFASVVLQQIFAGQEQNGREKIARMIEAIICDAQFPYAGLRVLVHELRFGTDPYSWTHVLRQSAVTAAWERCWAADGSDRNFAALALSDLLSFATGGAITVIGRHTATLASWISNPADGAYGFGYLLNSFYQQEKDLGAKVVALANPIAIAMAYSNPEPDTAYGLAELMNALLRVGVESFNAAVRSAIDRDKLREFAKHDAFAKDSATFSAFCASALWLDESLALDMAELFIPTAQHVLANDPVDGFHQLSHELASTVLRVFDVLGVYVGKHKPTRRQKAIARRMCQKIDPAQVAQHISNVRHRHFQSAGFFLHFLSHSAPSKYEAVLRQLDWSKLSDVIGNDWSDMPHDTEVLLSTLYSRPATRDLVQKFIADRSSQIVQFPPRLMLMVPDIGIEHLTKGGLLQLTSGEHVNWNFGGIALAIIADKNPQLIERAVAPFTQQIAHGIMKYHRDFTGPAEGLVRLAIKHAPTAWQTVLATFDAIETERALAECLTKDEDHRRTAAAVIESAIAVDGPVGDMVRRLRSRFPKASAALAAPPRFGRLNRRSRKQRK